MTYTFAKNGTWEPVKFEARDEGHAVVRMTATSQRFSWWLKGICWVRVTDELGNWFNLHFSAPQMGIDPTIGKRGVTRSVIG